MKTTRINSVSVVIEIEAPRWGKDHDANIKRMTSDAEDVLTQIRRHVDYSGSAYIDRKHDDLCSHCGANWTENSANYNGGCCDNDEAGNPENKPAPAIPGFEVIQDALDRLKL